ncbi:alpha/beta fold hydrolase [Archangium violaceum]|uniref:alpha/beta fold hydrolase n=1 Tax=Archangium violaceum TaxID=83451 RepID=UPI00193C23B3|nr:alpha/beta fold hydrolase [Archangium violaceum]QRK12549.1 alpha/beta fold hydrolase [Archangium violaceum]
MRPQMEPRSARIGDIQMRWYEYGVGRPLVLLHGIPTSPRLWRHVVPALSGVRVLAWELIGYGGSIREGRGLDLSVAAQARYLLSWMDALALERPILVGHDLGGGIAQIVATQRPLAGLLLVNCVAYDSWPIPSVKLLRAMAPLVRRAPNALVKWMMRLMFARLHDDPKRARESLEAHWSDYAREKAGAALVRQALALDNRDTQRIAPELRNVKVPARVVWGTRGPQSIAYAHRLGRDLGAPVIPLRGAHHFVPEDHPDVLAREIQALIEQVERPSPVVPRMLSPEGDAAR